MSQIRYEQAGARKHRRAQAQAPLSLRHLLIVWRKGAEVLEGLEGALNVVLVRRSGIGEVPHVRYCHSLHLKEYALYGRAQNLRQRERRELMLKDGRRKQPVAVAWAGAVIEARQTFQHLK